MPIPSGQIRRQAANLLRDRGTFGSVVLAILLMEYGTEVFTKDALEIYEDVKQDFDAVMPEELENKFNGLSLCITTDGFFTNPDIFVAACVSLLDGDLGDLVNGVMEDISVPGMLWAAYEVALFYDKVPPTSETIKQLITKIVQQEAEDIDGLEADTVLPYYSRHILDEKEELRLQLRSIGLSKEDLDDFI